MGNGFGALISRKEMQWFITFLRLGSPGALLFRMKYLWCLSGRQILSLGLFRWAKEDVTFKMTQWSPCSSLLSSLLRCASSSPQNHRTIVTSLLIRSNVHPVGFVLLALWAWSMTDSNCTQRRGDYTAGWFSECQCRFYLLQALMFLLACKSPNSLAANHTQDKEKPLHALSFKNVCNH